MEQVVAEDSSKAKEISLGDDFGDFAVTVNGARVEVHPDGSVDAYTDGSVAKHPAANDDRAVKVAQIGDRMEDGTIYAGISPDTGRPLYTTPADAPLTTYWQQAMESASKSDVHGRHDWRVPTKAELSVLYNNRAAIGGFNLSGSYPDGWYWTSEETGLHDVWIQQFSNGRKGCQDGSMNNASLRLVR
jgi:hypothetical protein